MQAMPRAGMQLREADYSAHRPLMLLMKVSAALMQCLQIWPSKRETMQTSIGLTIHKHKAEAALITAEAVLHAHV